jgi:hypothetical protein
MTKSSNFHLINPLHSSSDKPGSIKDLAIQLLQRKNIRNGGIVVEPNWIPPYSTPTTTQAGEFTKQDYISISPSLKDDFEERIAIAEYDGQQDTLQAHRIAYESAVITVLNANPPNGSVKPGVDWLNERIKSVENWLLLEGIERPA